MSKKPLFYSNKEDDMHCLQAVLLITLNSLGYQMTWEEADELTAFEPNLYSWTVVAASVISERIHGTRLVSNLDYKSFAEKGDEYLKGFLKREWYEDQKNHASIGFVREQKFAENFVSKGTYIHKQVSISDIEETLSMGGLVIALVNVRSLYGKKGTAAHFIVVYAEDNDNFIFHDPGFPSKRAARISKEAFKGALTEIIQIPKPKA